MHLEAPRTPAEAAASRLAFGLEYDGCGWYGWQRQPPLPSVEATVHHALAEVADHPLEDIVCAGRTDRGVHAVGQVIHMDTWARRSVRGWLLGTNRLLPPSIRMRWCRPVPSTFSARHSAQARHYLYVFAERNDATALFRQYACTVRGAPLDLAAMQQAAQSLRGDMDCSAFRSAQCAATTAQRRIHEVALFRRGGYLCLFIVANAFLHRMVRTIAGTLLEIGQGKRVADSMPGLIAAQDRRQAGANVPAHGLFFLGAAYARQHALPAPITPDEFFGHCWRGSEFYARTPEMQAVS